MKNLKRCLVGLLLTTIIFLLAPVSAPVQAATYNLVKLVSAVVSSGNFASNGTVVYDSTAGLSGLYKMWYVQTTPDDIIRSYIYGLLSSGLVTDLKAGNYDNVAVSASDSAAIQSVFAALAGLNTTQITTYLSSISTSLEYATSPDGTTCTNGGAITFPGAAWDQYLSSPDVIKDGSTYKMWYTGFTGNAVDLQSVFVALNAATASLTPANMSILLVDIVNGNITKLRTDIISLSLKSQITDLVTKTLTFFADSAPAIGYAESTDGIT